MKKRLAAITTVFAMLFAFFPANGFQTYAAGSSDLNIDYHTVEQIKAFIKNHPADLNQSTVYDKTPSSVSPYELGEVSDETLDSAINLVNQIRYIAGVPANVSISETYQETAQAGALVNAANNQLSHTPAKPSGMSDELYAKGYAGTSSSNLAYNSKSLNYAVLGWMEDSDSNNIDRVGHRRWIISPGMEKTGFGVVNRYYSMYTFDNWTDYKGYSNVAWPAQNTPVEYFMDGSAWSLSTGSAQDISKIKVTVKRISDGKTWNFSSASSDGEFYVDNNNYGQKGCIIFRPSGLTVKSGDSFSVSITGAGSDIDYNVNFFSLDSTAATTTTTTTTTTKTTTTTTTAKTTTTTTAVTGNYIEITGNSVNVRAGAGTNYKVLGSVKKGQRYKYYATKTVNGNKWYKIKLNQTDGWVIGTYAKVVSTGVTTTTTTAAQMKYIEVTEKAVNVRAGAGTHCKVIGTARLGQRYRYYSTKTVNGEKWYKIKFNGNDSWIAGSCVKLVASGVTTTTAKPTTTTTVKTTTTTTTAKPTTTTTTAKATTTTTTKATTTTTSAPKYYVLVTGNSVNIRSGAGTNYGVITSVKKNTKLTYLGEKTVSGKKWYNVKVNGKSGWIISTYSKLVSTVTTTTTKKTTTTTAKASYVVITGSVVNVRAGAGTNYGVVTSVKKGQKLAYSDVKTVNNTKWYKVTANGKTGWVVGTYASVSK